MAKCDALKLSAAKKQEFFNEKLSESVGKINMEHPEISWYTQENGCYKLWCNYQCNW